MGTLELVIPYQRAIPRNLDYCFDRESRQLTLTVFFPNQEDWRRTDEVHYLFEGVTAIIGSIGLISPYEVGRAGIYRVTSYQGSTSKFAFLFSDEEVKSVYAQSIRQL